MSCVTLPAPPPLPPLPAGFGLPGFTPPVIPGVNLCCKINPPPIPIPNIPGIPLNAAAMEVFTNAILLVDAVIDAIDTVNLSCPLDT